MTGIASAIANRNSQRVWLPIIGDSVTEGHGASALANRWASKASADLRTLYPTTGNGSAGGIGYLNMTATTTSSLFTWPISTAASWSGTPLGPVRDGWSMSGTGSWSWTTPAGTTSIRVMYYATGNGSVISVSGGSGGTVTITDSVAGTDGTLSVSIPVNGSQAITISYVSGPSLYISGVIHYSGDENTGITVHACGHYGWQASSWPGAQGFSGFPFEPSIATLANSVAFGIFLGINDCQAVNAATFQANVIALVNDLHSFSGLSGLPLVIVIPYKPNVSFVDSGGWNAYVSALYNVAANYSNTTVVDLNAGMPSVASDGGVHYADNVHPNDAGHALLASLFAAAMPLPASGSGGVTMPARTLAGAATLGFRGSGGVTMPARTLASAGAAFAPPVPAVIWRPCYCNRVEAQGSVDFPPGTDVNGKIDRALMDAAENIEGGIKRRFYPSDDTRFWDWPQQGGAGPGGGTPSDPWRLALDDNDLVCLTSLVAGGVTLGLDQLFVVPWSNPAKFKPYFSTLEIDRSTSASFGQQQQTPQNAIGITATWGYGADADPVGRLASAVGIGDPAVTLTSGAVAGPGDLLVLGYGRGTTTASAPHAGAIQPYLGERVLVTGVLPVVTGLTQSGGGVTSAEDSDQSLTWTGTGTLAAGEVITLDSEDMYVEKVLGSMATVRRAFNGTTLVAHSGAAIWAMRQYSVLRGQLGTAAGSYPSGAVVCRHRVPQLVRDLAIAETANLLLQEGSGYARQVGSGENAHPAPGIALVDKWAEARARHGRGGKARQRAV